MQTDIQRDRARTMRKAMTRAEVILWVRLRRRGVSGFRFNRQVEVGPYIVDFLCRDRRLVVEVDGALHEETHARRYDQRRTRYLEMHGLRVVRFLNEEVYTDIQTVVERLERLLKEPVD